MSPSWLSWLLRWCCSEFEDSEIRIYEFSAATACVLSRVFFLYSEFISGLDVLHTVHNSGSVHTLPIEQASTAQHILFLWCHDPYTLACKARPSFSQMLDFSECVIVIVIVGSTLYMMFRVRNLSSIRWPRRRCQQTSGIHDHSRHISDSLHLVATAGCRPQTATSVGDAMYRVPTVHFVELVGAAPSRLVVRLPHMCAALS